jgi:hypothetical protein
MTANIALTEVQFRTLVAGGVARDSTVLAGTVRLEIKIILSDIGFAAMRKAIDDAEATIKARLEAEQI